jgi:sugar lactone lactonase YvrE
MNAVGGSESTRILGDEPPRKRTTGFRFTEGAVWRGDDGVLIFSDIPGNRLYRFDPSTEEVAIYRDPSNLTNGNLFDRQRRLISCEHGASRVVREERDGKLTVIASHYDGLELNSPNDIVEDRQGGLYFTDPPYGRVEGSGPTVGAGIRRPQPQPVQGVYRVDPQDGSIDRLADDFDRPNGLCLSLDETTLFVSDTARGHIRRFSIVDDKISGGEVWADALGEGDRVDPQSGGATVVAEGIEGPHGLAFFAGRESRLRHPAARAAANLSMGSRAAARSSAQDGRWSLRARERRARRSTACEYSIPRAGRSAISRFRNAVAICASAAAGETASS